MDHTVPEKNGEPFKAMAQGRADYIVDVIPITTKQHGVLMTICATEEAVYITREQAAAFFGLVPKESVDAQVASLVTDIQAADKLVCAGDDTGALVRVRHAAMRATQSYLDHIGREAVRTTPNAEVRDSR